MSASLSFRTGISANKQEKSSTNNDSTPLKVSQYFSSSNVLVTDSGLFANRNIHFRQVSPDIAKMTLASLTSPQRKQLETSTLRIRSPNLLHSPLKTQCDNNSKNDRQNGFGFTQKQNIPVKPLTALTTSSLATLTTSKSQFLNNSVSLISSSRAPMKLGVSRVLNQSCILDNNSSFLHKILADMYERIYNKPLIGTPSDQEARLMLESIEGFKQKSELVSAIKNLVAQSMNISATLTDECMLQQIRQVINRASREQFNVNTVQLIRINEILKRQEAENNMRLNKIIETQKQEIEKIRKEKVTISQSCQQLRKENVRIQAELAQLKNKLDPLEKHNNELHSLVSQLNLKNMELDRTLSQLNNERNSMNRKNHFYQSSFDSKPLTLESALAFLQQEKEQKKALADKLMKVEQQNKELTSTLNKEISEVKEIVSKQVSEKLGLVKDLIKADSYIREIKTTSEIEIAHLKSTLQKEREETNLILQALARQDREVRTSPQRLPKLNNQQCLDQNSKQIRVELFEKEVNYANELINRLRGQEEYISKLQSELATLKYSKGIINSNQQAVVCSEDSLNRLSKLLQTSEMRAVKAEETLKQERISITKDNQNTQVSMRQLAEQNSQLRQKLEYLEAELVRSRDLLEQQFSKNNNDSILSEQSQVTIQNLERECWELNKHIFTLQGRLAEMQYERENERSAKENLQQTNGELQGMVSNLTLTIKEAKEYKEKLTRQYIKSLEESQKLIKLGDRKIKELQEEIEIVKTREHKISESRCRAVGALQAKAQHESEELAKLTAENGALLNRLIELQLKKVEADEIRQSMESQYEEISSLKEQLLKHKLKLPLKDALATPSHLNSDNDESMLLKDSKTIRNSEGYCGSQGSLVVSDSIKDPLSKRQPNSHRAERNRRVSANEESMLMTLMDSNQDEEYSVKSLMAVIAEKAAVIEKLQKLIQTKEEELQELRNFVKLSENPVVIHEKDQQVMSLVTTAKVLELKCRKIEEERDIIKSINYETQRTNRRLEMLLGEPDHISIRQSMQSNEGSPLIQDSVEMSLGQSPSYQLKSSHPSSPHLRVDRLIRENSQLIEELARIKNYNEKLKADYEELVRKLNKKSDTPIESARSMRSRHCQSVRASRMTLRAEDAYQTARVECFNSREYILNSTRRSQDGMFLTEEQKRNFHGSKSIRNLVMKNDNDFPLQVEEVFRRYFPKQSDIVSQIQNFVLELSSYPDHTDLLEKLDVLLGDIWEIEQISTDQDALKEETLKEHLQKMRLIFLASQNELKGSDAPRGTYASNTDALSRPSEDMLLEASTYQQGTGFRVESNNTNISQGIQTSILEDVSQDMKIEAIREEIRRLNDGASEFRDTIRKCLEGDNHENNNVFLSDFTVGN